ncbi:hypothetical protein [Gynuella sp.]|uniref:hypothetical protein n=1 Tax=Gynuella sp. TaxID=2969146 RepID=UPI003D0EB1B6
MDIDLSNPLDLPVEFTKRLHRIENHCRRHEFSDELVECREVSALVRDINQYCNENRIIGVHYTRALPESILAQGLLVRNGEEIRREFLQQHGHRFSEKEITEIKKRWSRYFNRNQSSARDDRIFFNFTEIKRGGGGSENLLSLYGGEQVSMCFKLGEALSIRLGEIGKPLVIRCALYPNQIKTFIEHPWGKILVSSFHAVINPNACRIDQDGYQEVPVKPEDVIEVRVLTNRVTR